MKTNSKVYFLLGTLATLGTVTLAYLAIKDSGKTSQELLDDGKKVFEDTVKKGDKFIEQTVDSIKKEAKSLLRETANTL
jgi:alanyl-tRNA synthetase